MSASCSTSVISSYGSYCWANQLRSSSRESMTWWGKRGFDLWSLTDLADVVCYCSCILMRKSVCTWWNDVASFTEKLFAIDVSLVRFVILHNRYLFIYRFTNASFFFCIIRNPAHLWTFSRSHSSPLLVSHRRSEWGCNWSYTTHGWDIMSMRRRG